MIPIFIDYETFWSDTHSLSKMSPITYVLHPETEIQSVAIKLGFTGKTEIIFGEDNIRAYYNTIDWSQAMVIAHNNSEFDAMIHAWRFGINPKLWGCTLAMARPIFAKDAGGSLKAVMKALGCPFEKGSLEDVNTKGKKLAQFSPEEIEKMRTYNGIDTEGCAWIFGRLLKMTPPMEVELIDMTIRMLVEPQFECDVPLLEKTLRDEQERKKLVLLDIATMSGAYEPGMTEDEAGEAARKMLASGPKFAAFMKDLGYEAPTKPSPSNPSKTTLALAKTDEAFLALQEHEEPLIAAAASARLGVKSTILETRIEKFLEAAKYCGGRLPMPTKYYGADTTGRWSGFIFNPQNLPRIGKNPKPSDALRMCIKAPQGHKVVVADLSGIELRVNMFLWKVPYAMDLFNASPDKADLYRYFAAHDLYDVAEDAVTKDQRQVGKVSHLGLGFGAGAATFQGVARLMGGVDMSLEESKDVVDKYRKAHPEIVQGWKTSHAALALIAQGVTAVIDPWGLCSTCAEGIKTPLGMIRYPNLHQEEIFDENGAPTGRFEWWYGEGRKRARIYAGKVVENIVQHIARCVIAWMAIEIKRKTGRMPKLTVHDELVYIVPENEAVSHLDKVQTVMRGGVPWWPELVTWSEGDIADTYGDAK